MDRIRHLGVAVALAACGLTLSSGVLSWLLHRETGLLTFVSAGQASERVTWSTSPSVVGIAFLADPSLPRAFFTVRWVGYWRPTEDATFLRARASGGVVVRVDGEVVVLRDATATAWTVDGDRPVRAGLHRVEVEYQAAEAPFLKVMGAGGGGAVFEREDVFPRPPARWVLFVVDAHRVVRRLVPLAWATCLGLFAAWGVFFRLAGGATREWPPVAVAAGLPWAGVSRTLAALVFIYGTALRFEALVGRYWYDTAPALAERVAAVTRDFRPGPRWEPALERWRGDPHGYLIYAAEMKDFYRAAFREPMFVLATKLALPAVDHEFIAVCFASAFFSALTVWLTYLVGGEIGSRGAGLVAAACLAVDRQVINISVEGWRDDCFAFFVLLCAYVLVRLDRRTTWLNAVAAGLAGGGVWLTRVTAISFLLPAHAWLLWAHRKSPEERTRVLASLGITLLLAGPYLVNNARVFGDPFFPLSESARFYSHHLGMTRDASTGWSSFLAGRFGLVSLLKTGLIGLTVFPFSGKWNGLVEWSSCAGPVLASASIAGMGLFLSSPPGRLILLILISVLVPYAFTWDAPYGNHLRYTLVAYPFYLLAAGYFLVEGPRRIASWWRVTPFSWRPRADR